MILNRKYYNKISFVKSLWYQSQLNKFKKDKVFKFFKLTKIEWPNQLYFYSPRLKRKPQFTGNKDILKQWKDAKLCESICPTNAIEVRADDFIIDQQGCVACGLCLEIAPEGLLTTLSDIARASVL